MVTLTLSAAVTENVQSPVPVMSMPPVSCTVNTPSSAIAAMCGSSVVRSTERSMRVSAAVAGS